jgi:3D (Asp-Asp-Asp) domain-containing protein
MVFAPVLGLRGCKGRTVARRNSYQAKRIAAFVAAAALVAMNSWAHRFPLRAGSKVGVIATAYCQKGRTESGIHTDTNIIAADPRVLPIGSTVRILDGPRRGVYTVLDTGAAIKGLKIDIFVDDCHEAETFGKRRVHILVTRSTL